jgi:NhaP-type Na+/H+ or K+/H+ antiporter
VLGGLAIGGLLGTVAGRVVLHLRLEHKEGVGRDEFLALGLIGLSYGAALLAHAYGFLAVFAAGLALRNIERRHSGKKPAPEVDELAAAGRASEVSTDPEKAPGYMAGAVLVFSERAERLLEVAMVLLVGFMFKPEYLSWSNVVPAGVLFIVVRPAAVFAGLAGTRIGWRDRSLFAWFGIRGIGSIYYLMYAIGYGIDPRTSHELVGITLTVVAISVFAHGVSVTPLMRLRSARIKRRASSGDSRERSRS